MQQEYLLKTCTIQKNSLHFAMESTKIFNKTAGVDIAVLGDLYLDEYIHGRVEKIADDGPAPILHSMTRTWQPAAAGYVALLLANFGCRVHLYGRVGADLHGQELQRNLSQRGVDCSGVLVDELYSTPNRLHINAAGAHYAEREMIRVIHEKNWPLMNPQLYKKLFEQNLPHCRALVVVDKSTGFITPELLDLTRHSGLRAPMLADAEHNLSLYHHFDMLIANENETAEALAEIGFHADSGDRLREQLHLRLLFISHGSSGLSIHQQGEHTQFVATEIRQVFDAVGAGEAVAAAITAGAAAESTPQEMAEFANLTAGAAIGKPGYVEIAQEDVLELEGQKSAQLAAHKIVPLAKLQSIIAEAKKSGRKVVWTNGCFDIMHVGHILYLEKARSLGDLLVVGLNSDSSVRSFKGPSRPIVEEKQRAKLLSALSCVDYVTIFSEPSPVKLLEQLEPDVFAKGGDYSIASLNQDERRAVERYGGRIELLPGVPGMSTSHLIEKILKTYQ